MVSFNWLHLTDLHLGMDGLRDLWPNVEEEFLEDVEFLVRKVGSLDLVLFTGDLVQRGSAKEFEQVNLLLEKFWHKFSEIGCNPKFLAVPGNHDLVRPEDFRDPAFQTLTKLWNDHDTQKLFWDNPESPQRKLVDKAFANYMEWWQTVPVPKPDVYSKGMLPGDFSATYEKEGAKLGIVGLNTTFLQLKDGKFERKLAVNVRQLNEACGGHGPAWINQHDLCLLLTHQPPNWLTVDALEQLNSSIHYPPRRFALHLFGHVHEPQLGTFAFAGSDARRRLQGCSLFGLEWWGRKNKRLHGYSLGQLRIQDNAAELQLWPRKAEKKQGGGWKIDRDISFDLPRGEDGIDPVQVPWTRSRPKESKSLRESKYLFITSTKEDGYTDDKENVTSLDKLPKDMTVTDFYPDHKEIEASLDKLHKDMTMTRLHPFIAQVKQWASATIYPPAVFQVFVTLFQQMEEDIRKGKPVQVVLEQAATRTGAYNQPSWDVDNFYQVNGNLFQVILNRWREKIESDTSDPKLQLPIVLFVMHSKEAHELVSGTAFQEYPDELRQDFDLLQQSLASHDIENWVHNYKQEPTGWQPFKDNPGNIEQLINQVLSQIEGFQNRIIPKFINIRTLSEEQNRDTLQKLRNEGCVVILDVISMQHPTIQRQFRQSLLDVFPTTIVARIAPVTDALHLKQRMIAVIEQHVEMEFYKRVHIDGDNKCQEISTSVGFAGWLRNQVPTLLPDDVKVSTDSREQWYKMDGR